MSNVYDIGQNRANERAAGASEWIAKLDRGLSDAEAEELHRWMQTDAKNEAELLALARLWDKMDDLARLSELIPHSIAELSADESGWRPWLAAAASVGVVVFGGLLAMNVFTGVDTEDAHTEFVERSVYETAIGGRSVVNLSDGSIITLNTGSLAEIEFDERQRIINLTRGEIHIEVAHDEGRPLSVVAAGRVVQAVGTAFTVRIDASQRVEVLVADGRVRVARVDEATFDGPGLVAVDDVDGSSLIVARGERALLDADGEEVDVLEPDEVEVRLSWRDGNLVFRGDSLRNAAAEVSRYTPIEFVFLDEDLQELRIAGLFKAGDVTGFLSSLEANFDIAYERADDQTILLSVDRPSKRDATR